MISSRLGLGRRLPQAAVRGLPSRRKVKNAISLPQALIANLSTKKVDPVPETAVDPYHCSPVTAARAIDTVEDEIWSDDVAELTKQRLAHEEAESKAIEEELAYFATTDATSGPGWYVNSLPNDGSTSFKVGNFFNCSPSWQTRLEALPGDHPIRAIFSLFKLAFHRYWRCDDDVKVRLYCYQLTDPYILDMLLHYCRFFPIHVILHPQLHTFKKVRENADDFLERAKASGVFATVGAPELLVNLIQVRAVTLDNLGDNAFVHRKGIMISDMSLVGSYNLSTNARKNNWETMDLIETNAKALEEFDKLWKKLEDRQVNLLSPRKDLLPRWEHREFDAWMAELSSSKQQKTS
jgi:PLD-like domain